MNSDERTPNYLRQWRDAFGLTQQQLGEAVGTDKTMISKLEASRRRLNTIWLHKFAVVFRCQPAALLAPPAADAGLATEPPSVGHRIDIGSVYGKRDRPIRGHARGMDGDEAYRFDSDELGLTYRPVELLGVRDAYAVYVAGTSMSPRFEPGEMVYIDPNRPVKGGDDVVVQLADGQGYIKRLVRRTAKTLHCRQFNPARDCDYAADQVKAVHLIVGATRVRV